MKYWQILCAAALILIMGWIIWRIYTENHANHSNDTIGDQDEDIAISTQTQEDAANAEAKSSVYSSKASIMTECEKAFFEAIREIVEPEYKVQPQINLASVIDKNIHSKYRNELFRNIDFGIFDNTYKLLVLVEINDETHQQNSRKERDQKIKAICTAANIPLVTFWTKYGVNRTYIRNRLSEHLVLNNYTEHQPPNGDA